MSRPIIALDARLVGGTNTGDSTYWSGLIEALAHGDCGLDFLLFSNAPRPQGIPNCRNFRWIEVPSRSNRWWSYVSFPLAARKMGAKAIHTQYSLSPLAGSCGITTVHDVSFFIGPEWFRPKDRVILQRTVPASVKRAARVIAVSQTCQREIEHFIPGAKGKVRAIYNGLPSWIAHDPAPQPTLDRLQVQKPFILTVGTRWPRKNMSLAVDAAKKLDGIDLVVTGKPGWGSQPEGSRVRAVGYVANEELCSLYSAASLYLAPSRHEGFGIPLIEAFACGCPVLCSTGGALPEVAGEAAEIEPTWDPEHWAATIRRLLADSSKLEILRQKGIVRAKQFDWKDSARQTVEVYREVLG
ncbi:MAG: glycosyltransferase family 4 protein [Fimbriimonadaceae bacterium]|nr:glycosyltransferase family 4 protein [Fimbriimonadaceae bacterium]